MTKGYEEKLDGQIDDSQWKLCSDKWKKELAEIEAELSRIQTCGTTEAFNVLETLELSQIAHSQFLTQNSWEKRKLLDTLLSNCTLDGVSVSPVYKKPFSYIAEGVKMQSMLPEEDVSKTFKKFITWVLSAA